MSANKDRSADKTVLGVSMPKALKDRIAALAHDDRRDMAPWCVIQLEKAVEAIEKAQKAHSPVPEKTSIPPRRRILANAPQNR